MRRFLTIILGLIAVAAAIAIALYARSNYMSSVTLMTIPVPKGNIPPYTMLDDSHFVMAEFPSALQEKGTAFALRLEDLRGRITTSHLAANVPVPKSLVATSKEFRLADPKLQVISIPISLEMAIGGRVRIGEKINVYRIVVAGEQQSQLAATPAPGVTVPANQAENIPDLQDMENVKVELVATVPVIDVLTGNGQPAGAETTDDIGLVGSGNADQTSEKQPAAIVLVAVPEEQAEDLMRLIGTTQKGGELMWITLARADGQEDSTQASNQ